MASIMIIDDEILVANYTRRMIEDLGHSVVATCTRAREAVETMERARPQVLLIDISLDHGQTGPELLRTARERGFTGAAYFLSAYPETHVKESVAGLDYIGFLDKPIDSPTLAQALSAVVSTSNA